MKHDPPPPGPTDYLNPKERAQYEEIGRKLALLYRARAELTRDIESLRGSRRRLDFKQRSRARYAAEKADPVESAAELQARYVEGRKAYGEAIGRPVVQHRGIRA